MKCVKVNLRLISVDVRRQTVIFTENLAINMLYSALIILFLSTRFSLIGSILTMRDDAVIVNLLNYAVCVLKALHFVHLQMKMVAKETTLITLKSFLS